MSFFGKLWEKKVIDASALTFTALGHGLSSKTGLSVTELTALRVSVVWACCQVLTQDIGKVPLKLMRTGDDESEKVAREHPLHRVLYRRPNSWQTSMEWRQLMLLHALLSKGGYSYINRSLKTGEVLELIPLLPGRVTPKQADDWTMTYEVSDGKGRVLVLDQSDVHVLTGLSWDGLCALQVIQQGKEAIALALAAEETQARHHGQGARPGGVFTTPNQLSDVAVKRLKEEFAANYSGVQNAFKGLLLDNGIKFEPWMMTGVDGQHLETRRFQIEEVCRLFRVFPAMVGYADKTATFASAEAFFTAHVTHSLHHWAVKWEQAMERDLLGESELRQGLHIEFFLQGLMRGDAQTRSAFYASGINNGWMTRNEARKLEGMNPLTGLDKPLQPLNMVEAGTAPKPPAPKLDPGADPTGDPPAGG